MNECGILLYAHNNAEIDYARLATINALMVRHHMKMPCSLVTDEHSHSWAVSSLGEIYLDAFDHVIIQNDVLCQENPRDYQDTRHNRKTLPFRNNNRTSAWQHTPYQETLLMDVDYMVMNDHLNAVWKHTNNLMIHSTYQDVLHNRQFTDTRRLHALGIPHYWATVIYFRKDFQTEIFFQLAQHIQENYLYYANLYGCQVGLFRNDYVFSMAAHMFSGFTQHTLPGLPVPLMNSFDLDDIYKFTSPDRVLLYVEKPGCPGDFILTEHLRTNLHIMNKWALNREGAKLLEMIT